MESPLTRLVTLARRAAVLLTADNEDRGLINRGKLADKINEACDGLDGSPASPPFAEIDSAAAGND